MRTSATNPEIFKHGSRSHCVRSQRLDYLAPYRAPRGAALMSRALRFLGCAMCAGAFVAGFACALLFPVPNIAYELAQLTCEIVGASGLLWFAFSR